MQPTVVRTLLQLRIQLMTMTCQRQKKALTLTLTLTLTLGAVLLVLAHTPYSPVHSWVHCSCSLRQKADDLNQLRTHTARQYFSRLAHRNRTHSGRDSGAAGPTAQGVEENVVISSRDGGRKYLETSVQTSMKRAPNGSSLRRRSVRHGLQKHDKGGGGFLKGKQGSGVFTTSDGRKLQNRGASFTTRNQATPTSTGFPPSALGSRQHASSAQKKNRKSVLQRQKRTNRKSVHQRQKRTKRSTRHAPSQSGSGFRKKRVKLAIAIITVRRRYSHSLGYVIQSAAALHSLSRQRRHGDLFEDSFLFVCNVDAKPESHTDAVFLEKYIPVIKRYGTNDNSSSSSHFPSFSSSGMKIPGVMMMMENVSYHTLVHENVFDKERVDYMFCLQSALLLVRPEHVLVVEDDAVALPDMPSVVQHALDRLSAPSNCSPGFVYLKLYFPLYWQGFAFELIPVLDLVCMSAVLSPLVACCFRGARVVVAGGRRRRWYSQRGGGFLYIAVLSAVACLLVGRQNLNELRRVSESFYRLRSSPRCCTPAVLYPSGVVPSLLAWLARCGPQQHVDLCLAQFLDHTGLPGYGIEPNLFVHVGTVTSLVMGNKDPEEVLFYGVPDGW
ncbi:uncharacterized protein LOC143275259 [Babylonia areolata]|uniref:uncharacterized protein LOC143275259 n=1 Tax=Babylonia areolata TaxID=304850 RepID=UPI003FD3EE2D